jgi:hypothetical protein
MTGPIDTSSVTGCTRAAGLRERLRRVRTKIFGLARDERLEGAISVAEIEIERRCCAQSKAAPSEAKKSDPPCWAKSAATLLEAARAALRCGRLDEGWRLLHAARRMEILGMEADKEELKSVASNLRSEAEKVKSWRQKAIERIVGSIEKPIDNVTASSLYQAAGIRDEHYDNQAYKDRLLRTQMLALALTLIGVLGLLALVSTRPVGEGVTASADRAAAKPAGGADLVVVQAAVSSPTARTGLSPEAKLVGMVALFGLLGGTVSAMLRASDPSQSSRIPELTAAMRVTFMRILMGAASAIVIYVFIKSPLGASLSKSVFSEGIGDSLKLPTSFTAYVIAFVAGFSERLVLRAVESVAGKADDKSTAKPATA